MKWVCLSLKEKKKNKFDSASISFFGYEGRHPVRCFLVACLARWMGAVGWRSGLFLCVCSNACVKMPVLLKRTDRPSPVSSPFSCGALFICDSREAVAAEALSVSESCAVPRKQNSLSFSPSEILPVSQEAVFKLCILDEEQHPPPDPKWLISYRAASLSHGPHQ